MDALEDVDRMLGEYNSIARKQAKSIDKVPTHYPIAAFHKFTHAPSAAIVTHCTIAIESY